MLNKFKFTHGFVWGVVSLFTVLNLGLFYFNVSMLKDQRHFSFFNTEAGCNFIDPKTWEYQDVMKEPEFPVRKK